MQDFKQVRITKLETALKTKPIKSKRLTSHVYLPKDEFEQYQKDNNVRVIGNIKIRQRLYRKPNSDYSNKPGIIGICQLKLKDSYVYKHQKKYAEYPYIDFDLYESSSKRCFGYAHVGGNDFVRLTKTNALWLIIPLIIILLGVLISSCPKQSETPDFEFAATKSEVTASGGETTTSINAAYRAFAPEITLTKEQPYIFLYNSKSNEGAYYQTYEVYVNGNLAYQTDDPDTKELELIEPGHYVAYDMWSEFDAGSYNVICKVVSYEYETIKARPQGLNPATKVTIEK